MPHPDQPVVGWEPTSLAPIPLSKKSSPKVRFSSKPKAMGRKPPKTKFRGREAAKAEFDNLLNGCVVPKIYLLSTGKEELYPDVSTLTDPEGQADQLTQAHPTSPELERNLPVKR